MNCEGSRIRDKPIRKEVRRLLAEPEQAALQLAIAADPEAHPIVPGTGGVRKARWARQGGGKSDGVRVIYYYWRTIEELAAQVLDREVVPAFDLLQE